ncbi:MAG: DNA-binding protein [Thermodesulfobacteriota bacterium]
MRRGNKSTILYSHKLPVENKTLFVDFKENEGGKFLQIAELSNDKRSTVIVPGSGVTEFLEVVEKIKGEYL